MPGIPRQLRVSIVTSTYNRAALLPEAIESVLAQDYPNIEYIVLDDGSRDNTLELLTRYRDRVRVESHPNMGEHHTVNKGVALSSGDIVCVVNSDDPLLPGAVRRAVEQFEANPDAVAVYPDWAAIGPRGELLWAQRLEPYDIRNMLHDLNFGIGPGAFFRRAAWNELGGRREGMVYCGDMDFWLRLAFHGRLVHIPEMLATHRTHPGSASVSGKGAAMMREWVGTLIRAFRHPDLPPELAAEKDKLQARMWKDAIHYCGSNVLARLYVRCAYLYFVVSSRIRSRLRALAGRIVQRVRSLKDGLVLKDTAWVRMGKGSIAEFRRGVSSAVRALLRALALRSASWLDRVRGWIVEYLQALARRLRPMLRALALKSATWLGKGWIVWTRWTLGAGSGPRRLERASSQRFAFCTRFLPPMWSGQAVVIGRLLHGLSPDAYCLVTRPVYPDRKRDDFIGTLPCTYHDLPPETPLPRFRPTELWRWFDLAWTIAQRARAIARVLKNDRVGTLIGCSGDPADPPAAFVASRILGCRFFMYFFDDFTEQWWADPGLQQFIRPMERMLVAGASGVLVPNEYMQQELWRRYSRASSVVRNPCPVRAERGKVTAFPATPPEIRLVFTGAVYHLNYDIFKRIIEAIRLLGRRDVTLHIYTAQADESLRAQGLEGPQVFIHGHVPPAEAVAVQATADILLIPFSFDQTATGIVRTSATAKLADYLMTGRPVMAVCPLDTFLGWYLTGNECGVVVPSERPEDIAAAIARIIDDVHLRNRLRQNALDRAATEFNPAIAQSRLLSSLGFRQGSSPRTVRAPRPDAMNILHLSGFDTLGAQVNGYLLHEYLREQGHRSRMLVYGRQSDDPDVAELGGQLMRRANEKVVGLQHKLGLHCIMPILSMGITRHPWVREADVVHAHLLHSAEFFSLLHLPGLSRRKRVIVSVHDMFVMTGHCVYSLDCERWRTGCGACPYLDIPFQTSVDRTALAWKLKHWAFRRAAVHLVVGSPWQRRRVEATPILSHLPVHYIPYGVDTRHYHPMDKETARLALGIPKDAHVIAFRSVPFSINFKGTQYIEEALMAYQPQRPTYLLTFEGIAGLNALRGKYRFVELGWLYDPDRIAQGLAAADVFLMPSTAEGFGLMAMEAMACGTPSIVFEGTALPETVNAPHCGIAVPYKDSGALCQALTGLLGNEIWRNELRERGLKYVQERHTLEHYAEGYIRLYQGITRHVQPSV